MGFVGFVGFALALETASAATPTLTRSGKSVRWSGGRLELSGRPDNHSDLSSSEVFQAAIHGLRRWEAAALGAIEFDYWQGSDPRVFEANGELNGQSSLYFASQSAEPLDPEVLGLTQVWYEADSGRIIETDIVLNDRQFRFTTEPRDTTGYGSGLTGGGTHVFIENVLTHELGHAFGLSHSGLMQATMLHTEGPEQAHLGCDDEAGIREVYQAGAATDRTTGGIRATIEGPDGRALPGAQLVAISRSRGTVVRASLAAREALLLVLEPGIYDLLLEPFAAGAEALPAFYASLEHRICPGGALFRRQFVPGPFEVRAGKITSAGRIRASCDLQMDGTSLLSAGESSGALAATLERGSRLLRLEHSGGDLAVRLLSFSLFSPEQAVGVLRSDFNGKPGSRVAVLERSPMEVGESGFVNFDTELRARTLAAGVYWLQVSAESIPVNFFPGGLLLRDPEPFFVALAWRGELESTDPRCRQDERFAPYSSPPGDPPRRGLTDAGRPLRTPACGGGEAGVQLLAWLLVVRCLAAIQTVCLSHEAARHQAPSGFCGGRLGSVFRAIFGLRHRRDRTPARLSG